VIAAACAAMVLILAWCAGYAWAVLRGHSGGPGCLRRAASHRAATALLVAAIAVLGIRWVRRAVLRARWAWRCRGCPPRNDGQPLGETEHDELTAIRRGWKDTARTERSRT
jgi:hypothetical protein